MTNSLLEHREACKKLAGFLRARNETVLEEVHLPNGKGAVDVVSCGRNGKTKYFEVKSHPTSIRQGGLQRQFERYEQNFPDQQYLLAFPVNSSEMMFIDYKTERRETIKTPHL